MNLNDWLLLRSEHCLKNIVLAMLIKVMVLGLGVGGVATLWEAVIADVGVALLAILNAVRIQKM